MVAWSGADWFAYATPGQILSAAAALPTVSTLIVALRFYTRFIQKLGPGRRSAFGIDDFLILPALVLVWGMGIALIVGKFFCCHSDFLNLVLIPSLYCRRQRGSCRIRNACTPSSNPEVIFTWTNPKTTLVQKVQFISQVLMTAAYGFIKLSVVYFYRRVFVVHKGDWLNLTTHIVSAVIVVWTVAYLFAVLFECGTHWSAHWTSYAALFQYCLGGYGVQHLVESLLITDLITDVLILGLPMPRIWSLHLTPWRKVAVTGILLLGAVATGAAAARLAVFISQIRRSGDPILDENMSVSTVVYWSMIEAGLSLIAACLPTAQHIFRGRSLGSVVASVRSAISLPSITRTRRSGSGNSRGSRNIRSNNQPYSEVQTEHASVRRLADSKVTVGRSSAAGSDSNAGLGVKKTLDIEMTTHSRREDEEYERPPWDSV